jgi:hypothetical protein
MPSAHRASTFHAGVIEIALAPKDTLRLLELLVDNTVADHERHRGTQGGLARDDIEAVGHARQPIAFVREDILPVVVDREDCCRCLKSRLLTLCEEVKTPVALPLLRPFRGFAALSRRPVAVSALQRIGLSQGCRGGQHEQPHCQEQCSEKGADRYFAGLQHSDSIAIPVLVRYPACCD